MPNCVHTDNISSDDISAASEDFDSSPSSIFMLYSLPNWSLSIEGTNPSVSHLSNAQYIQYTACLSPVLMAEIAVSVNLNFGKSQ